MPAQNSFIIIKDKACFVNTFASKDFIADLHVEIPVGYTGQQYSINGKAGQLGILQKFQEP